MAFVVAKIQRGKLVIDVYSVVVKNDSSLPRLFELVSSREILIELLSCQH